VFLTEAPRDVNASSIASVKYSLNFCAKILSGCESFTLSTSVFWVFWESEIPASIKTGSLIEAAGVDNESLMFFWFVKFYSPGHFVFSMCLSVEQFCCSASVQYVLFRTYIEYYVLINNNIKIPKPPNSQK